MDNNHQHRQNIEDLLCSVPTLDLAFRQLSEHNIFPDCTIICSDEIQIQAHKRYLCAYSTYFESELGSDIKTRRNIHIDAASNIVMKLLDFLYTFTIDPDQSIDDTKELLRLSQTYNFAELKRRMSYLLVSSFTPSNVFDICNFAQLYQATVVRRCGAKFVARNMKEIEEKIPDWKEKVDSTFIHSVENWIGFSESYTLRHSF